MGGARLPRRGCEGSGGGGRHGWEGGERRCARAPGAAMGGDDGRGRAAAHPRGRHGASGVAAPLVHRPRAGVGRGGCVRGCVGAVRRQEGVPGRAAPAGRAGPGRQPRRAGGCPGGRRRPLSPSRKKWSSRRQGAATAAAARGRCLRDYFFFSSCPAHPPRRGRRDGSRGKSTKRPVGRRRPVVLGVGESASLGGDMGRTPPPHLDHLFLGHHDVSVPPARLAMIQGSP